MTSKLIEIRISNIVPIGQTIVISNSYLSNETSAQMKLISFRRVHRSTEFIRNLCCSVFNTEDCKPNTFK